MTATDESRRRSFALTNRTKLLALAIPSCWSITLMLIGARLSNPVESGSDGTTTFQAISPIFWLGTGFALGTLGTASVTLRGRLQAILVPVFFLVAYSTFLLYPLLPGSDSHFFRGSLQLFVSEDAWTPSANVYFQWPGFFILGKTTMLVVGLRVEGVDRILFLLLHLMLGLVLYEAARRGVSNDRPAAGALIYVVAAFVFLDYQFAAQSVAFILLLISWLLLRSKTWQNAVLLSVTGTTLMLTHAILGPVLVAAVACTYLLERPKDGKRLARTPVRSKTLVTTNTLLLLVVLYGATLVLIAGFQLQRLVNTLFSIYSLFSSEHEYLQFAAKSVAGASNPLDVAFQSASRLAIVGAWILLALGMIGSIRRRTWAPHEKGLLAAATAYLAAGAVVRVLGTRAVQIAAVPVSATTNPRGTSHQGAFTIAIIAVCLLFVFSLAHQQFDFSFYQTQSGVRADQFLNGENPPPSRPVVVAASREDGGYLYGFLDFRYYPWTFLTPGATNFPELNASVPKFDYLIASAEFYHEVTLTGGNAGKWLDAEAAAPGVIYTDGQSAIVLGET